MQRYRKSFAALPIIAGAALFSLQASADDHGCQVLLCLANPGGATQYAECVPPITKLYQDLAKGKAFPTCSGGGVETSTPVHDPYYCSNGHVLDYDGSIPLCRSAARTETVECPLEDAEAPKPVLGGPIKAVENGIEVCKHFVFSTVRANEKPTFLDVTIIPTGKKTRIRF